MVGAGHPLSAIRNYGLTQFLLLLDGVEENDAAQRENFVMDVVSALSALGGAPKNGEESHLEQHLRLLHAVAIGEKENGKQV